MLNTRTACLFLLVAVSVKVSALPSFPGAVGFGTQTRGAWHSTAVPAIFRVTHLGDEGPGSLREALEAQQPRVVIFEVGGTIFLHDRIKITGPYLTVAGQTAPSPGITVTNHKIEIRTHDVLFRHLRIRVGDNGGSNSAETRDALTLCCGDVFNVVLDHLTLSWSIDEIVGISAYGPDDVARDITISNCIMAEALDKSLHPEGAHSDGILIAPGVRKVSLIRNLLANNAYRNPLMQGNTQVALVNNMFYNWRVNGATIFTDERRDGPFQAILVNNLYRPGPDTSIYTTAVFLTASASQGSQLFMSNNVIEQYQLFRNDTNSNPLVSHPPFPLDEIPVYFAASLPTELLPQVGARPQDRDAADKRLITGVQFSTGRIISTPIEADNPETTEVRRPLELPGSPHAVGVSGYTRLEEWLHDLSDVLTSPKPRPRPPVMIRNDLPEIAATAE